jgi:hypothetical protein
MNLATTTLRERTTTIGNLPLPLSMITWVQQALPPVKINARDLLHDEFASDDEGELLYPIIKNAILQGRKVQLSVKNLDLDGGFFDTAICKLYGDFDEITVDQNVEVVDIDEVDYFALRDMKEVRKLYYYNRTAFDQRMKNIDPELNCNEDLSEEFVLDTDDIYAPGKKGRWIDANTGEEYFI